MFLKFKKYQKVVVLANEKELKQLDLVFGVFGLKALETVRLSIEELESIKKTIKKILKKEGNIWIKVIPNRIITLKPAEVRMGKGKGHIIKNVAVVKNGMIFLEIGGSILSRKLALFALNIVKNKIGLNTKIIEYKR